jgi:hypothetical protein
MQTRSEPCKEKFKKQPDRLKQLLKNAERFTCPIQNIEYISVPSYSSRTDDSTEWREYEKMNMKQDEEVKKPKAPKVKTPKAIADGTAETTLTYKQQTRLEESLPRLEEIQMKLSVQNVDIGCSWNVTLRIIPVVGPMGPKLANMDASLPRRALVQYETAYI